jgi:pyrroloquinoline-quinone synthase
MQAFLATLHVSRECMAMEMERSAVRAFNLALLGACMMEDPTFAFACLGVIEYAFADISALIGKMVVQQGWIAQDELVHYKLHAEIDKRHAADFFSSVAVAWTAGGIARETVLSGLKFGCHIFHQLYANLYQEALEAS